MLHNISADCCKCQQQERDCHRGNHFSAELADHVHEADPVHANGVGIGDETTQRGGDPAAHAT
jgi:hypothetical protein